MDRNLSVLSVIMFVNFLSYISGEVILGNVTVHIWEGNVTVTWDPPQKKPGGCLYQVQILKWETPKQWKNVSECNMIKSTICNVGALQSDLKFKVRVGLPANQGNISWSTSKSYNIRDSQIFAPTFDLSSTSTSVQVKIHRKQMPEDLFPYGMQYTFYLWPDGQENETMINSVDDLDDTDEMTFKALQSLRVYCVHVKIDSKATSATNISPVQCIKLPLGTTLILGIVLLGILTLMAPIICFVCLIKRPGKMPTALKPVVSGWHPLIVGPVQVETVNNKGWILITDKAETKMPMSDKNSEISEEDKERRESLDSGVSMDHLNLSDSNTMINEPVADMPADSGCGSMKLTEGPQHSPQNIHRRGGHQSGEDSGLGMGHQEISDSLEGEESGLLSEVVVGDGYRSQSPSSVEETPNETSQLCDTEMNVAFPVYGYKSAKVTCMCLDHEYCIWCKSKKTLVEDCPQTQDHASVPTYLTKGMVQTESILNVTNAQSVLSEEHLNSDETCQFLFTCSPLLRNEKPQSCLLNSMSFRLDDAELTFS